MKPELEALDRIAIIRRLQDQEELIEITSEIRVRRTGELSGQPTALIEFDGDHALARRLTGCWPEVSVNSFSAADRALALAAALSEYRDDPKVGEIRGFIVNVDCPIHGAPAVASVSDVKTNVEEDASHE